MDVPPQKKLKGSNNDAASLILLDQLPPPILGQISGYLDDESAKNLVTLLRSSCWSDWNVQTLVSSLFCWVIQPLFCARSIQKIMISSEDTWNYLLNRPKFSNLVKKLSFSPPIEVMMIGGSFVTRFKNKHPRVKFKSTDYALQDKHNYNPIGDAFPHLEKVSCYAHHITGILKPSRGGAWHCHWLYVHLSSFFVS